MAESAVFVILCVLAIGFVLVATGLGGSDNGGRHW
jgi:hypothetical protein